MLPEGLDAGALAAVVGIATATLASEDLACVSAGLLVGSGVIEPWVALVGCGGGIWLGDIGVWAIGRAGRAAAGRRRLAVGPERAAWLQSRRAGALLVASRFVPGTRVALYLAAGALGVPLRVFAAWTLAAVLVWTPALVGLSAWLGQPFIARLQAYAGAWWPAPLVVAWLAWLAHRVWRTRSRQSAAMSMTGGSMGPSAPSAIVSDVKAM
jgi:membrane protein DedA with SNARE-associated domain